MQPDYRMKLDPHEARSTCNIPASPAQFNGYGASSQGQKPIPEAEAEAAGSSVGCAGVTRADSLDGTR